MGARVGPAGLRALPPGSQSQTIEFGEYARLLDPDGPPVPGSTTDLGSALRLAGSLLPRDTSLAPEVVLLTDGWSTAAAPPSEALPSGVAVSYVVAPRQSRQPVAVVRSLQVPPMVRVGDDVDIEVGMHAAEVVDADLRVMLDRNVVADGTVHLDPGENHLTLTQHIDAPGFLQVRAELKVNDLTSTLSAMSVGKAV